MSSDKLGQNRWEIWLKLLEIERAEVHNWHKTIIQATITTIAAMLALTGFFVSLPKPSWPMAGLVVFGLCALATFYWMVSRTTEDVMKATGENIIKLENFLDLHAPKGTPSDAGKHVYPADNGWPPPIYIKWMKYLVLGAAIANFVAAIFTMTPSA